MAFFLLFIQNLKDILLAKSEDPNQMLHTAASDLGLCCLPMSHKKDTRRACILVKKLKLSIGGPTQTSSNGQRITDLHQCCY